MAARWFVISFLYAGFGVVSVNAQVAFNGAGTSAVGGQQWGQDQPAAPPSPPFPPPPLLQHCDSVRLSSESRVTTYALSTYPLT